MSADNEFLIFMYDFSEDVALGHICMPWILSIGMRSHKSQGISDTTFNTRVCFVVVEGMITELVRLGSMLFFELLMEYYTSF